MGEERVDAERKLKMARLDGLIDPGQFREEWGKLSGEPAGRNDATGEILDKIFTACDNFVDDPRLITDPTKEYGEDQLRLYVRRVSNPLLRSAGGQSAPLGT